MKYLSKIIIKSFRKHELKLLINFFSILKNIFLKNIFFEFVLLRFSVLFRLFFDLFIYKHIIKHKLKNNLIVNLFNNYFYLEKNWYLHIIVYYNLYNYSSIYKYKILNKLLYKEFNINFILKFINNLKFNSFSSVPNRNKYITVLRSPHTDKKSREQFLLKEYKKCIKSKNNLNFFDLLINIKKVFSLNTCILKNKKYIKLN